MCGDGAHKPRRKFPPVQQQPAKTRVVDAPGALLLADPLLRSGGLLGLA